MAVGTKESLDKLETLFLEGEVVVHDRIDDTKFAGDSLAKTAIRLVKSGKLAEDEARQLLKIVKVHIISKNSRAREEVNADLIALEKKLGPGKLDLRCKAIFKRI